MLKALSSEPTATICARHVEVIPEWVEHSAYKLYP